MSSQTSPAQDSSTPDENPDESKLRELYRRILAAWNNCNAVDMAALFNEEGYLVGFDGSQVNGRAEIESKMGPNRVGLT